MGLSWWDIPGPVRFVRKVENDLLNGINVLAALPNGLGIDWFKYFHQRWRENQRCMDTLDDGVGCGSPLDVLSRAFTTNPVGCEVRINYVF